MPFFLFDDTLSRINPSILELLKGLYDKGDNGNMMTIVLKLNLACISLIITALMLAGIGHAEIEPETVVGLWLFDEDEGNIAGDSSGNGHDGQINNANWVDGKFGSALEFTGIETVTVPHAESLSLQDHTICFWAKVPEITGNWQAMVVKEAGGPLRNYGLYVDLNNGAVHYGFSSANQWKSGTANTPITDGEWHFIAQAYNIDEQDFRLYIDGVVDFQRIDASEPDTNSSNLQIGSTSFFGTLDEVAIFNVGLEEGDIFDIMNDGLEAALGWTAVLPLGKLTATWAGVKVQQR